jgi:hypothetical protein
MKKPVTAPVYDVRTGAQIKAQLKVLESRIKGPLSLVNRVRLEAMRDALLWAMREEEKGKAPAAQARKIPSHVRRQVEEERAKGWLAPGVN